MRAYVEKFNESEADAELISKGYTHTVAVWGYHGSVFLDLLDLVDFKNEFAARTYADAVNMGIAV